MANKAPKKIDTQKVGVLCCQVWWARSAGSSLRSLEGDSWAPTGPGCHLSDRFGGLSDIVDEAGRAYPIQAENAGAPAWRVARAAPAQPGLALKRGRLPQRPVPRMCHTVPRTDDLAMQQAPLASIGFHQTRYHTHQCGPKIHIVHVVEVPQCLVVIYWLNTSFVLVYVQRVQPAFTC